MRVGGAGDEAHAVSLDDARVVAGPEPARAGPGGEREQCVEPEGAVAAAAGVRSLSARIAVDEGRDDGSTKLLAQVERDVREPERVAGLAGGHDGRR